MKEYKLPDWVTWVLTGLLCLVALVGIVALLFAVSRVRTCEEGVSTEEAGDFKIVEVETRGEKHEYLYYHQMYRGSMCHLPNCKYCTVAGKLPR